MTDLNIVISRPNYEEWPNDTFVDYFYRKAEITNAGYDWNKNYLRDVSIMKQIIKIFKENSRNKTSVIHFIEWGFQHFTEKSYILPITVGVIRTFVPTFLQIPWEKPKKVYNHKEKIWLSEKQREWLREQKKLYGTDSLPKAEVRTRKRRSKRKGAKNAR